MYGKRQMLPRPTAEPVAARMNMSREDHMPWMEVVLSMYGSGVGWAGRGPGRGGIGHGRGRIAPGGEAKDLETGVGQHHRHQRADDVEERPWQVVQRGDAERRGHVRAAGVPGNQGRGDGARVLEGAGEVLR